MKKIKVDEWSGSAAVWLMNWRFAHAGTLLGAATFPRSFFAGPPVPFDSAGWETYFKRTARLFYSIAHLRWISVCVLSV